MLTDNSNPTNGIVSLRCSCGYFVAPILRKLDSGMVNTLMLAPANKLKVLRAVVRFVAINMVHVLVRSKKSANGGLHDKAVLANVSGAPCGWVRSVENKHIAASNNSASIPHRVSWSSPSSLAGRRNQGLCFVRVRFPFWPRHERSFVSVARHDANMGAA